MVKRKVLMDLFLKNGGQRVSSKKFVDYCLQDVKITKDIFEYARDNKKLSYTDLGVTSTITIDTSSWEKEVSAYDKNASLF